MQLPTEHITERDVKYGIRMMTPAGLQSLDSLRRRRLLVLVLNVASYAAMLFVAARILGSGGWTAVEVAMIIAFGIGLPWTVLGFWNAIIGLTLLHATKDPLKAVAPFADAGDRATPLALRTAVLMTLRNEDAARAIGRLRIVQESLDATGEGGSFSYFVLSDTNDPVIAEEEEAVVAEWQAVVPPELSARIEYRRREENTGFKAGNVRDFCARWGGSYDLMLPLDADSLMAGDTIVRLVRMMQAYPRIGILQSLVVGMPSTSAFARIFQFGMRHGMRSYTMGQAWWVGECGPFWGHNAAVRIRPFLEDCELPVLNGEPPFGGPVLSHDQYEATLMRRAGYEVRVLPQEGGSWEENPPTIREFLQRDVRWCQGNMQYLGLLATPGLYPISRFQLVWAILMFVGIPAWTLMIALLPIATWQTQNNADFPGGLAVGLYIAFFIMYLMPKLAGLVDTLLTKGGVMRYGGFLRFAASAVIELIFSFLQGAVSTIRTTVFMAGLLFGVRVNWGGQARDSYGLTVASASRALWPQTLFGVIICSALIFIDPTVFYWSLPLTIGYILAMPFAVISAHPAVGRWMRSTGLAGIPEDFDPPWEVQRAVDEHRSADQPHGET
ncbi:MAG: glucans biosynthesis glucosyltransferase MdoH [Hyphomicrobiaceae bacterium]